MIRYNRRNSVNFIYTLILYLRTECIFTYVRSRVVENLPIDATNLGTSQTLHADETGTIAHYSGDQTFTSVRNLTIFMLFNNNKIIFASTCE